MFHLKALHPISAAVRGLPNLSCATAARKRVAVVCVAASLLAVPAMAQTTSPVPLADPIPALIPASRITVDLKPIASGFVSPVMGTTMPGDDEHIYVADQVGKLYKISVSERTPGGSPSVFLDVSDRLVRLGLFPPLNFDERGLLGVAFHPDFRRNGLFYTFTSQPAVGAADFSTQPPGSS